MISAIGDFTMPIPALIADIQETIFNFFSSIANHSKKHSDFSLDTKKYVAETNAISNEFNARFTDFRKIEKLVEYILYPFKTDLKVIAISEQAGPRDALSLERGPTELKMFALNADVFLKVRAFEDNFWKTVSSKKYPTSKNVMNIVILALVQPTYVNLHFHLRIKSKQNLAQR